MSTRDGPRLYHCPAKPKNKRTATTMGNQGLFNLSGKCRDRHRRQWRHRARRWRAGLARSGAAVAIVGRNAAKSAAGGRRDCQHVAPRRSPWPPTSPTKATRSPRDGPTRVVGDTARIDILVNNAGINIRKPPHDARRSPSGSSVMRHQPDQRLRVLAGGLSAHEERRAAARSSTSAR